MSNYRILIIDDVEEIHNNIHLMFKDNYSEKLNNISNELFGKKDSIDISSEFSKFEISSAFQGEEGVELVKKSLTLNKPFSVIVVDMRMPPGWDGLKTIEKIREIDQDAQIIICSAYSDYSWLDIANVIGLSDKYLFLSKPFEVTEFKQMVLALNKKWLAEQEFKDLKKELELLKKDKK